MPKKKNTKSSQRSAIVVAVVLSLLIIFGTVSFFLVLRFVYPTQFEKLFKTGQNKKNTKPSDNVPNTPNPIPNVPEHDTGTLTAAFIDVGQGDSMFMKLPDGKTLLVDGGNTGKDKEVIPLLQALNVKRLDYVLLTHTDADHCGGLDKIIDQYKNNVGKVFLPKINEKNNLLQLDSTYGTVTSTAYSDFVKSAKNSGASLEYMLDVITISGNYYSVDLYCRNDEFYKLKATGNSLWLNDVSPIGVVSYKGRKMVFTGDANGAIDISGGRNKYSAEKAWLEQMEAKGIKDADFDADIYKAGHHGSNGSSSDEFLEFIDCEYAVVSSGCGKELKGKSTTYNPFIKDELHSQGRNMSNFFTESKYGHPTKEVCGLDGRLRHNRYKEIYYTCLHGNIFISINNLGELLFSTEKEAVPSGTNIVFTPNPKYEENVLKITAKFTFVISSYEIENFFSSCRIYSL